MARSAPGYRFLDHTADVGIAAEARTLAELFGRLADGLAALLSDEHELKPDQVRAVRLQAESPEDLLLAWLQELLYWFSTDRFLPLAYEIEVTPTAVAGRVRGTLFEPARHQPGREVKAITRHHLQVARVRGVWHGQVIVDI